MGSGRGAGAALAWLVSFSRAIPGFGPLIAAGPVLAALAGAGAGGALGGSRDTCGHALTEYVAETVLRQNQARRHTPLCSLRQPGVVYPGEEDPEDTGARDISSAPESAADYGTTDTPTERAPVTVLDHHEAACPSGGRTRH